MLAPLWILALLSLAAGVGTTLAGRMPLPDAPGPLPAPGWLMGVAVGASVGGILLAWAMYQRRIVDADRVAAAFGPVRRAALARFWVDDVIEAVYRGAVVRVARAVGWVDRYLVDGVLNDLSERTLVAGDRLRRMQTGRAQDYVYGLAIGLLVLVAWVGWLL